MDLDCNLEEYSSSSVTLTSNELESRGIQRDLIRCSSLLSIAAGHLSSTLCSGRLVDDFSNQVSASIYNKDTLTLKKKENLSVFAASSPVISFGVAQMHPKKIHSLIDNWRHLFPIPKEELDIKCIEIITKWQDSSFALLKETCDSKNIDSLPKITQVDIDNLDAIVAPKAGGVGSLCFGHGSIWCDQKRNCESSPSSLRCELA